MVMNATLSGEDADQYVDEDAERMEIQMQIQMRRKMRMWIKIRRNYVNADAEMRRKDVNVDKDAEKLCEYG